MTYRAMPSRAFSEDSRCSVATTDTAVAARERGVAARAGLARNVAALRCDAVRLGRRGLARCLRAFALSRRAFIRSTLEGKYA